MKKLLFVVIVLCTFGFGYFLYQRWQKKKRLKELELELEEAKKQMDELIFKNTWDLGLRNFHSL